MKRILYLLCTFLLVGLHTNAMSYPDRLERDKEKRSISISPTIVIINGNILHINSPITLENFYLQIYNEEQNLIFEKLMPQHSTQDYFIQLESEFNSTYSIILFDPQTGSVEDITPQDI